MPSGTLPSFRGVIRIAFLAHLMVCGATAVTADDLCPVEALTRLAGTCSPGATIVYGDALTGEIDPVGDIDQYLFNGAIGEVAVAQLVMSGFPDDPKIELCRPDGTHFDSASSSGSTARIDGVLDQTGCWTIFVSELDNSVAADYTIVLERVAPPSDSATPICYGCDLQDRIEPVGDLDEYRFSGVTGEVVSTQLVMSGFPDDPRIELFRPDGTRFDLASSNGSTARIDGTLDQTGDWVILVSELDNSVTADYTIVLERVAPPSDSATPICYGCDLQDRIEPVGDLDLFEFFGFAGETMLAQLVMSGFPDDPRIELFRPDGTRFDEASSNGTAARIESFLNQTGRWSILVSELENTATADYTIVLEKIAPCFPPIHLDLQDFVIDEVSRFENCNDIRVGPDFRVLGTGQLTLHAGGDVVLREETSVERDGTATVISSSYGKPIRFGMSIEDQIDPVGDLDIFRFSGTDGQTVSAQLVMSGFPDDPRIELFRPDGTLFDSDSSNGSTATVTAVLNQTGEWSILISELDNAATSEYTLTLVCIASCA